MGDVPRDQVVGRARELAELERWYAEARDGQGRLALVVGEPGIGKTRLVEEFTRGVAADGVAVAWGHAVDDVNAPALRAWHRALRQLPGGADITDAPGDWFAFADAVIDVLTAAADERASVVVLDDLQWADSASLRLLRHVAREMGRSHVLLIGMYRDTPGEHSQLAEALPALLREPRVEVLRPGPLQRGDVHQMLTSLADGRVDHAYADVVHQRTGGNPLYVRTLARLLAAEGGLADYDHRRVDTLVTQRPELRQLVLALLAPMSQAQRGVISTASVIGERFDLDVLRRVTEEDVDEALRAGTRAGVLVDHDGWRFAHALLRDGVYADLDPARRAALHRRVAAVLTDNQADAAVIAGHWARADDLAHAATTVEWSRRAGREAVRLAAYDEGIRWAELALDVLDKSAGEEHLRADILVELAGAEFAAGHVRRAMDHALTSAHLAGDDVVRIAHAALVVQGINERVMSGEASALCRRALAALPKEETLLRARLLAQLVNMNQHDTPFADQVMWSGEALALAEKADDPVAIFEALRARQSALCAPAFVAERIDLAHRVARLADRGFVGAATWAPIWMIDAAFQLGDMPLLDRELDNLAAVAGRLRSPLAHWHHARLTAARLALAGDFTAALEAGETAMQLAVRMQEASAIGMANAFKVRVAMTRGDGDAITDEIVAAVRTAPQMILVRTNLVFMLMLRGDTEGALGEYQSLRGVAPTLPVSGGWLAALGDLAELAATFDDAESARVTYDLLEPLAAYCVTGTIGTVYCAGSVQFFLGRLAAVLGDPVRAEKHFRGAVAVNDAIGAHPAAAEARMRLAETVTTTAPAVAVGLAQHAVRTMRRLDMTGRLRHWEPVLARLQSSDARLTRREREVADLVATGQTNKEIAATLVLSERTVESHVANILVKLECTSRTQIALKVNASRSPV